MKPSRRYHGNHPCEHKALRSEWISDLALPPTLPIPILAAFALHAAWFGFCARPHWTALLGTWFSLLVLWSWGRAWLVALRYLDECQILVLYRRRVGETCTFTAGDAISRNLRPLDERADALGAKAISDFGFSRYSLAASSDPPWHEAKELLDTITALLADVRANFEKIPDAKAIRSDLKKWERSLRLAADQGVEVRLHVRKSLYSRLADSDFIHPHSFF